MRPKFAIKFGPFPPIPLLFHPFPLPLPKHLENVNSATRWYCMTPCYNISWHIQYRGLSIWPPFYYFLHGSSSCHAFDSNIWCLEWALNSDEERSTFKNKYLFSTDTFC
jgi:hypothetical protein